MRHEITVMNFSNIYTQEHFYENDKVNFLDLSDLEGTNCYCDSEAMAEIMRRIQKYSPYGIHFIDSGNYHYLSKLWTDKLKQDFTLVVFDHHPDMQPSLFQGLMSCGCWVKNVIDTNPFVKQVILVGTEDSLLPAIEKKYEPYLFCIPESHLLATGKKEISEKLLKFPVYISIDKDVLSKEEVITNWNQGNIKLALLKECLSDLFHSCNVLGIDICGECESPAALADVMKNTKVNEQLLELIVSA